MTLSDAIERMPPSSFSFVMATGIVGTAFATIGLEPVAVAALIVASVGYVALIVATATRAMLAPDALRRDARDPGKAFGFFTVVAATGVTATLASTLGIRWILPGALVVEALLWLALVYALLPWIVTHPSIRPLLPTVDGGWFLLVVATQSLSVLTSTAAGDHHLLSLVALGLWSVGIVVYLLLMAAVLVRMLSGRGTSIDVAPTAWVLTGATAISVFAASRILTASTPALPDASSAVTLVAMTLWAFGTLLIPFLIGLGIRDLAHRRDAWRFSVGWWSIVFPLGMYATATLSFGSVVEVEEFATVGTIAVWCAGVAWLIVTAGGVVRAPART
ncbi:tellurite resistance/C4-dicarboxylate transporter family protein [Microbacterium pseudoresistens]|uniref:Tellurite resistance protein TehA-like permease n=1 Tax=Microbacterium pseudoresistens TaxID=640634 RepID=A0A7Y9EYA6_9MICO|nr:tellurite resistance/C4-dicarboxylate transporter family protein [Microbacterium pseudoresistens]NYD55310.1 tellurite resistance protein TehA-like permease [Microbacterium pseudoresistens]